MAKFGGVCLQYLRLRHRMDDLEPMERVGTEFLYYGFY